jgi:hypothetical protein
VARSGLATAGKSMLAWGFTEEGLWEQLEYSYPEGERSLWGTPSRLPKSLPDPRPRALLVGPKYPAAQRRAEYKKT